MKMVSEINSYSSSLDHVLIFLIAILRKEYNNETRKISYYKNRSEFYIY